MNAPIPEAASPLAATVPASAAGRRFDELVRLIEDYEARRAGYDLERMRRALAAEG